MQRRSHCFRFSADILATKKSFHTAHLTKKVVRVSEVFVEDFKHYAAAAEGRFPRVRYGQQEALHCDSVARTDGTTEAERDDNAH